MYWRVLAATYRLGGPDGCHVPTIVLASVDVYIRIRGKADIGCDRLDLSVTAGCYGPHRAGRRQRPGLPVCDWQPGGTDTCRPPRQRGATAPRQSPGPGVAAGGYQRLASDI